MTRPLCMAPDEYQGWLVLNAALDRRKYDTPCSDCLTPFAEEMRAAGTCDGEPGTPPPPCGATEEDHDCPACHLASIRAAAVAANAARRAKRQERIQTALGLFAEGYPKHRIAKLMGVNPSTVARYLEDAAA